MSIRIMSAVFEATDLTPTEKLVALAMADHASDDGRNVYPGYARLGLKTGCDKRTIQRTISALMDKGWIKVERKHTHTKPTIFAFVRGGGPVSPGGHVPTGGVVAQSPQGGGTVSPKPSGTIIYKTSEGNSICDEATDLDEIRTANALLRAKVNRAGSVV